MSTTLDDRELKSMTWALRFLGFFSGGAVMIVEFSGNRLLTPIFGNSLYTWTGLIGVILVALSCGDYYGGRLADRLDGHALLTGLFSIAGVLTAGIPLIAAMISPSYGLGAVVGAVVSSLALFFFPGITLAAVTPVSIRLLSRAFGADRVGTAAGTVGMSAALGSFVGTFATSYLLIPHFGVRAIFSVLGAILIGVSICLAVLGRRRGVAISKGMVATWAVGAIICLVGRVEIRHPDTVYVQETAYHRIAVLERETDAGRARVLLLDSTLEGGHVIDTGELVYGYQKFWELAEVFSPRLERAVFIGAGAFGMPAHLSERFPATEVDVVEIDPAVIEVGRKFFRLDEHPRVVAHAGDGRRFLRQSQGGYDLIFGDAYNGVQYVPAHLVTREFFSLVRSRLAPGGIYMMNVIGALEGSGAEFFWGVRNTLQTAFPHILVFAAEAKLPTEVQNFVLVACVDPLEPRLDRWTAVQGEDRIAQMQPLLRQKVDLAHYSGGGTVFEDDRNPVEYVIAKQLVGL